MKPVPYNHNKISIFAVMGVPDMTVIPFPDAEYVEYINNWGNQVAVKIGGDRTWQDLYNAADIAIRESGDSHHVFIERFVETDNVRFLELWTGS